MHQVVCVKYTDLLGDVVTDIDLLVVQKHAVDSLDGSLSSLCGLVVNETVALGAALLVSGNLARQNVTESGERVVKGLVVDSVIQVLDENVALAGLAEGGVTLRPHDAAAKRLLLRALCQNASIYSPCAAFDERIVQLLQSTLT